MAYRTFCFENISRESNRSRTDFSWALVDNEKSFEKVKHFDLIEILESQETHGKEIKNIHWSPLLKEKLIRDKILIELRCLTKKKCNITKKI